MLGEDESFIDDNQYIYPAELRRITLSEVGYLPVLDWGCAPTYGQLPQYWKSAYYEVVVTGLASGRKGLVQKDCHPLSATSLPWQRYDGPSR